MATTSPVRHWPVPEDNDPPPGWGNNLRTIIADIDAHALFQGGVQVRLTGPTTYVVAPGVDFIECNTAGGVITLGWPKSTTYPGRIIRVKRTSTANSVSINLADAFDDMDGGLGIIMNAAAKQSRTFISNGVLSWLIVGAVG